jgi:hypothetical protein
MLMSNDNMPGTCGDIQGDFKGNTYCQMSVSPKLLQFWHYFRAYTLKCSDRFQQIPLHSWAAVMRNTITIQISCWYCKMTAPDSSENILWGTADENQTWWSGTKFRDTFPILKTYDKVVYLGRHTFYLLHYTTNLRGDRWRWHSG